MAEELPGLSSDELRALAATATGALKVFPLPDVVVLPGPPTPLHVFEDRYRALAGDALGGDRTFAVATLRRTEDAPQSRAPLQPVAGVAFIEADERLAEGRYNLVLRGAARARLVEELERGKPYREFKAELLEDRYPEGGPSALRAEVEALAQLVYELANVLPSESGAPQLAELAAKLRSPGQLADVVAAAVVSEPASRYRVLAELDVRERLAFVSSEVAGVVLMLSQGRNPRA